MWNRSGGTPEQLESPPAEVVSSAEYVDAATCRGCHQELRRTFRETGMGRSFHPVGSGSGIEISGPADLFHHETSSRYYSHVERDGRYCQRRYQKDPLSEGKFLQHLRDLVQRA